MKIISKFKDYYDSISHQFLDKDILYIRDTTLVCSLPAKTLELANFIHTPGTLKETMRFHIALEVIGFCGNLYPVILVTDNNSSESTSNFKTSTIGFYELEDFLKFARENGIPLEKPSRYSKWYSWRSYRLAENDLSRFFSDLNDKEHLKDLFLQHNTPCFVVRKAKERSSINVELNPFLKGYSFAKVKDPFSAHQELYQFVGGFLKAPERDMVEISDADKIHKHGFDKWSFRKPPTK